MEKIIHIIAEHASFFHDFGNYVLMPLFIFMFIFDWKISKSNFSKRLKRIAKSLLSFFAIVLAILIYMINLPLEPMINSLSKVDDAIGTQMVDFKYLNVAIGEIESLNNYKDKIVVLNFWGTYCPPCIKEFPDLKKLETNFSDDIVVIAISDENPEKIKQFVSKIESPSIIGYQKNYEWINPEKFLPLTVIINKGKVVNRFFGRKSYYDFVEIINTIKK